MLGVASSRPKEQASIQASLPLDPGPEPTPLGVRNRALTDRTLSALCLPVRRSQPVVRPAPPNYILQLNVSVIAVALPNRHHFGE